MNKAMKRSLLLLALAAFTAATALLLPKAAQADDISYVNTVYLRDGGTGDGSSAATPAGDLVTLLSGLAGNTHVILTGDYTTAETQSGTGNTRLDTSSNGVGIRFSSALKITAEGSAKLIMASHIVPGGPLELDDLTLQSNGDYWFKCQLKPFTVGENVRSVLGAGVTTYPTIVATTTSALDNKVTNIKVGSGSWNRLRGGSSSTAAASSGGAVFNTTISGGTFYGYVGLGSRGRMTGATVNAVISGGEFKKGVFLIYGEEEGNYTADYTADITVTGGTVHGVLAPSDRIYNTLSGTYRVTVTGGDFTYTTDIMGTGRYQGTMTSQIRIPDALKDRTVPSRAQTFQNPIMGAADPFLFEKDGYYYMVKTASTKLQLFKGTSLAELGTVTPITVFALTDGNNLWSPEVHYFSEAEAGAGNAGWYCFIGYTEHVTEGSSMSERQRQYVLKCLDPDDDLLGSQAPPYHESGRPRIQPEYVLRGLLQDGHRRRAVHDLRHGIQPRRGRKYRRYRR